MSLQYFGLHSISGSLVVLDHVKGAQFDEMARIVLDDGTERTGRVAMLEGDKAVLQIFEGTHGLSLNNTRTQFTGRPMEIPLSADLLGRVFTGAGRPADGLGEVMPEKFGDINGLPLNPVSRQYPRNYIETGISSIDCLMTLIRGQKLPIFSGTGLSHNKLAVQIVQQARIAKDDNAEFAVVFAAMGIQNDVADYFRRSFAESGVLQNVVMFLNLANDPIVERIITPRCALTAAEYLAYEKHMHILVVMTDMTAYAEALREFSSSKGEIPGRKGFPGYLYSDLASMYERAGIIEGVEGSVTQLPILTMPNDDITHPVPDLTGYITEGQIVLERGLEQSGVYPPIAVLPSLSRLMKDGIGEGYTRGDHAAVANQLFASYAQVQDARSLASVIGEEELSALDRQYLEFGKYFESCFLSQGFNENRSMEETLDLGWTLLSLLPKSALDRVDDQMLSAHYDPAAAAALKERMAKNG
ncbi:MAG: V-type ATP synthase subunit B [Oscillospiraceae bacterium]|nr:V-type ATP synthase subunit B [Oscillospiraceae bacterium]